LAEAGIEGVGTAEGVEAATTDGDRGVIDDDDCEGVGGGLDS